MFTAKRMFRAKLNVPNLSGTVTTFNDTDSIVRTGTITMPPYPAKFVDDKTITVAPATREIIYQKEHEALYREGTKEIYERRGGGQIRKEIHDLRTGHRTLEYRADTTGKVKNSLPGGVTHVSATGPGVMSNNYRNVLIRS